MILFSIHYYPLIHYRQTAPACHAQMAPARETTATCQCSAFVVRPVSYGSRLPRLMQWIGHPEPARKLAFRLRMPYLL
ncbi:MAG: hypothetical protein LIP09_12295 [Bacteroidales bacterium]|nr:hypothetical protein [Bacteroidales bacterium]